MLIVISASGNSPNLVEAVKVAREYGVTTVGFLGFDGGVLKEMVDLPVWLPTNHGEYGLVESAHSLLCHVLSECLVRDRQPAADATCAQPAVTR